VFIRPPGWEIFLSAGDTRTVTAETRLRRRGGGAGQRAFRRTG